MRLKIMTGVMNAFCKKHPNEERGESLRYLSDDRIQEIDIDDFTDEELVSMLKLCEAQKDLYGKSASTRIKQFQSIRADPKGRKVARLEDLTAALTHYFKKSQNHWIFVAQEGVMLPYLIKKIQYYPYNRTHETAANVCMDTVYLHRGHEKSKNFRWDTGDLRGGVKVDELLAKEDAYIENDEFHASYSKSMLRYKSLQGLTGHQFTATGEGVIMEDRWSSGNVKTAMEREGVAAKLVMDDKDDEGASYGDSDGLTDNLFWGDNTTGDGAERVMIPVHPYVKMFNLDAHQFTLLHTDQLTEYRWSPALIDKLILPKEHKQIVFILMDTAREDIDDIISGKSGGTIVICTGDPGTGKTLTAEVTSEVIKAPLYKVQCSQLGTTDDNIEKKLGTVLKRATRWNALLLIDEADVYVRERGIDINQNAIVGVFLRVLEYYRGILFLTSNRATIIDDAIMSRATVHIRYTKPTRDALYDIWKVLSTQFGCKLSDPQIEQCVKLFPKMVGRDVKAILKLGIRYSRREGGKVTPLLLRKLAVHKDIIVDDDYAKDLEREAK